MKAYRVEFERTIEGETIEDTMVVSAYSNMDARNVVREAYPDAYVVFVDLAARDYGLTNLPQR